jgi:outer membrane murein-binding lipoprotein Lpp
MTETFAQARNAVMRNPALMIFGLFGSVALIVSGCAAQRKHAIPWSTAVLVRPAALQQSSPTENIEDPLPELRMEIPPPPGPLAVAHPAPVRPRGVAPSSSQNASTGKLDTPQIVPDLSSQESASLQHETVLSLGAAERNLAATAGKTLNATQSDLASKVRSFISDAREAGRVGDWERARELAKKAQILSEELAGSM